MTDRAGRPARWYPDRRLTRLARGTGLFDAAAKSPRTLANCFTLRCVLDPLLMAQWYRPSRRQGTGQ